MSEYMTRHAVALALGIPYQTFYLWYDKHSDTMPKPARFRGHSDGYMFPEWRKDQMLSWQAWKAAYVREGAYTEHRTVLRYSSYPVDLEVEVDV